jgi:ATP synthase protein I
MTKITDSIRKQFFKILYWQLTIIVGLALVIALLQGIQKGFSAIMGSLAYWIPTLIFIWRVTAYAAARAATQFMMAFFAGEVIKLVLSAVLFLIAVHYFKIDMIYGIVGLIGSIVAFWVVSVSSLLSEGNKI